MRSLSSKSPTSCLNCMKETEQMNNQAGNNFSDRVTVYAGKNVSKVFESRDDKRLAVYGGSGHVNLQGVTQSTVPKPFKPPPKDSLHRNAVGSTSVSQIHKYLSSSLKETHQSKDFSMLQKNGIVNFTTTITGIRTPLLSACLVSHPKLLTSTGVMLYSWRCMASQASLSKKDRLKKAVKDYGSTVVVFHVAISLTSLGCFYLAVSRLVLICLIH